MNEGGMAKRYFCGVKIKTTPDAKAAYSAADFVVIAASTNVYSTKSVEV